MRLSKIEHDIKISELYQLLIDLEIFQIDDFEISLKSQDEKFHDCEIDLTDIFCDFQQNKSR